jgi:hypothetical protein
VTTETPKNDSPENVDGRNYEQRLSHPRRCNAHRQRDGKPCGRWAIKGGYVCWIHGGGSPRAQRKAKERIEFAKAIALERAVRGMMPDPSAPPDVKRMAEVVVRRVAKRPAGPPTPPKAAAPVAQPELAGTETQAERPATPLPPAERPAPLRPHFAEPTEPPKRGLTTAEDAMADVARANRRAGALSQRQNKRSSSGR